MVDERLHHVINTLYTEMRYKHFGVGLEHQEGERGCGPWGKVTREVRGQEKEDQEVLKLQPR